MKISLEAFENGATVATGAVALGAVVFESARLAQRTIQEHRINGEAQAPIQHNVFVGNQDSGDFGFVDLYSEYTNSNPT